jgi:hypothetical protein
VVVVGGDDSLVLRRIEAVNGPARGHQRKRLAALLLLLLLLLPAKTHLLPLLLLPVLVAGVTSPSGTRDVPARRLVNDTRPPARIAEQRQRRRGRLVAALGEGRRAARRRGGGPAGAEREGFVGLHPARSPSRRRDDVVVVVVEGPGRPQPVGGSQSLGGNVVVWGWHRDVVDGGSV